MSTTLSGLSASVTRILYLTGFSKELKTKDIQTAFSDWDNLSGGFKIKWRDDTSLLIVFQDASVAKRAYLHTLAYPPPILINNATGIPATVKPYDGADAQNVIQTVNSRGQNNSNNASRRSNSISGFQTHRGSISNRNGNGNGTAASIANSTSQHITIPEYSTPNGNGNGREPSPTLPNLPSHPTLNSLINSSLGEAVSNPNTTPSDPAILATSLNPEMGGPRIGDSGKRMLGAALGVRHPGLAPRVIHGGPGHQGVDGVERAMGGLVIAE
ncbi:hypothetical protein E1B28_001667 [Marasmius oreades]|uniref:Uncharacterized protein n=1 Tax=Marasmius oreades TaxID=181124 RepID=A0A9P7V3Y0_9AGAR|nr:uncharacterized protein E1B28_001667 [Marasmius oreades]KAG7099863.1 hypothetical protein E1B28_001667 [Marasmius oreades]